MDVSFYIKTITLGSLNCRFKLKS